MGLRKVCAGLGQDEEGRAGESSFCPVPVDMGGGIAAGRCQVGQNGCKLARLQIIRRSPQG